MLGLPSPKESQHTHLYRVWNTTTWHEFQLHSSFHKGFLPLQTTLQQWAPKRSLQCPVTWLSVSAFRIPTLFSADVMKSLSDINLLFCGCYEVSGHSKWSGDSSRANPVMISVKSPTNACTQQVMFTLFVSVVAFPGMHSLECIPWGREWNTWTWEENMVQGSQFPGCPEVVPEGDQRQGMALSELALTPAPSQMEDCWAESTALNLQIATRHPYQRTCWSTESLRIKGNNTHCH